MALSFNRIVLAGNIGRVDVRTITNGVKVANISLATTERYTDRSGAKQEITSWHNLEAFGAQVDFIEKYLQKGDSILIEGSIGYQKYTDKNGVEKTVAKIKVLKLQALTGKREAAAAPGSAEPSAPIPPADDTDPSDDLPF